MRTEAHQPLHDEASVDSLPDKELEAMRDDLLEKHADIVQDIELIDGVLMGRHQQEFNFDGVDNYEYVLGQAVLRGEIDAAEAYEALGQYDAS